MTGETTADEATLTFSELVSVIREDRLSHRANGLATAPGFHAIAAHRFGVWERQQPALVRLVTRPLYRLLFGFARNFYGIEIPATAKIGRNVVFGHQHGIVIHDAAVIGDGCILRHGVTIGAATGKSNYDRWLKEAPRLGRDVKVGVGAVILGAVTIGDGAHIGPNVVVTTNIPAGATVVANPPRVLKPRPAVAPDRAANEG